MNNQNVTKKSLEHLKGIIAAKEAKIFNIELNIRRSEEKIDRIQEDLERQKAQLAEEKQILQGYRSQLEEDQATLSNKVEKGSSERKETFSIEFLQGHEDLFNLDRISVQDIEDTVRLANIQSLEELLKKLPRTFLK